MRSRVRDPAGAGLTRSARAGGASGAAAQAVQGAPPPPTGRGLGTRPVPVPGALGYTWGDADQGDQEQPMSEQHTAIYDDKAQVRGHLDLSQAQWRLAAPEGTDPDSGDFFEVAFVQHTDGVIYTVLRK